MNYESLHNHTTTSDGEMNYFELLDAAEKNGFSVVAFSDHDALPSEKHLKELQRSYSGPVKWIIGCEISSGPPKELAGTSLSLFHILGLFVDPLNADLMEHSKRALKARVERMERMVKAFQKLGFTLSVEDCLRASGGESVGRPHVAKALLDNEENLALIEKFRKEMKVASIKDEIIRKKYEDMMMRVKEKGDSGYVFPLFLLNDAFVPGVYVDYLYMIDMDKSVELIRKAGGIAILAHWGTVKDKINIEMLERFLKEKRLDGVEIAGITGLKHPEKNHIDVLQKLAEKRGVIQTIGIDAHRAEDFEFFAHEKAVAEKTIGMTQKIIDSVHPSLKWSNLND